MKYRILIVILIALSSVLIASDEKLGLDDDMNQKTNNQVVLDARQIDYDKTHDTVVATGEVEVRQKQRLLLADKIIYDQKNDILYAEGDITLHDYEAGDIYYGDNVKITNEMKEGIINNLRAKLSDNSTLIAKEAERVDGGNIIRLKEATYTPCIICRKNCINAKQDIAEWQIRSKTATLNKEKQEIVYNHVIFDLVNTPIFYVPYFSHPSPDADKKTGFLIPGYKNITELGSVVSTPYYLALAPNYDATITPLMTSKEGIVMTSEFRHLTTRGTYKLYGSVTKPENHLLTGNIPLSTHKYRAHITGNGYFNFADHMNGGFNIKRTSDKTYLRTYRFGEEDYLTSKIFADYGNDRNYALAETVAFQGLRPEDVQEYIPMVLPYIDGHYNFYKMGNDHYYVDYNFLSIMNPTGDNFVRRLTLNFGVNYPYITDSGFVFSLAPNIRSDFYIADYDRRLYPYLENKTYNISRFIPSFDVRIKYPLAGKIYKYYSIVEPQVNITVASNTRQHTTIINQDSQNISLSDDNIFNSNHYTGYDRVETGTRINYGLTSNVSLEEAGDINFTLGAAYRARKDPNFPLDSGLADNFSDIVSKIGYSPKAGIETFYRVRLSKDNFDIMRDEIGIYNSNRIFDFSVSYNSIRNYISPSVTSIRQYISGYANLHLNQYWTIGGLVNQSFYSQLSNNNLLYRDDKLLSSGLNMGYKSDCMEVRFSAVRNFTRNVERKIIPSTEYGLQIFLKNLN